MPKILHFFSNFSSLGGVESVLRLHAARDREYGIDSAMVIACEPEEGNHDSEWAIPVRRLGIRGWHFVSDLRNRFRKALEDFQPRQIVFHNAWACRHLVDLIGDAECILMIHTDSGVSRNAIRKCHSFTDMAISVSQPIAAFLQTQMDPERVTTLGYPISPPDWLPGDRRPGGLRLGYVGRLVTEQKRVERIPSLLAAARSENIDFSCELLGDGPCRAMLEEELPKICRTVFHGRLSGPAYWDVLRSWDIIVFTSDYEGTPISLLEALSQGVVPIYPEISSGGDDIIRRVDPDLLYPAGHPEKAIAAIKHVVAMSPLDLRDLRSRLAEAVKMHRPANYLEGFRKALAQVSPLSRRVLQRSALASFPMSLIPFAAVRRLSPDLIY